MKGRNTLVELLNLTETMVASARTGDWDDVARMNSERKHLLGQEIAVSDSDDQDMQGLRRSLRLADSVLVELACANRDRMAEDNRRQRSRSTAVQSYREAQTASIRTPSQHPHKAG